MPLLHHIAKAVNRALGPLGVAVSRSEKTPWNIGKKIADTQVGRFKIQVPTINPICRHYQLYPNWSSQLGRLTSILKGKYANLAAIDVGANVGDTACIIKSAEDIPLLCIEGDEFTFGFLQKNIAQFRNTSAHQLFLGEKTTTVSVDFEKAGWNTTLKLGSSSSAKAVKLTSLDDFLVSQPGIEAFKLLKIDTEWFDCSIIRGGSNFIQNVSPVITFEYNRGNMDAIGEPGLPTLSMLQGLGYSRIAFHDQDGRFLLSASMADTGLVQDLHDYADCVRGRTGYLDITVFQENDTDLAEAFVAHERTRRAAGN